MLRFEFKGFVIALLTDDKDKCLAIFAASPAAATFDIGFSDEPPTMN